MTPPDSESKANPAAPIDATQVPSTGPAPPHAFVALNPLAAFLARPALEVVERLEGRGIACWVQGDALLNALDARAQSLAGERPSAPLTPGPLSTTLLCEAEAAAILGTLPGTVATAAHCRRLSLGTAGHAIDFLPLGPRRATQVLPDFGLSAHSFAWRPATDEWADPLGGRVRFDQGLLDAPVAAGPGSSIFALAPRRFWIAGRLLAEHSLRPSDRLLESARGAFESCLASLPRAAVARREIERVLAAPDPEAGLTFWNRIGLTTALFPGLRAANAKRVDAVRPDPILRFAVWLDGASAGRSLRLLRMPHERATRIDRLLRYHPIETTPPIAGGLQARVQRLRKRLEPDEIASLIEWRRVELDASGPDPECETARARLAELEAGLAKADAQHEAVSKVRALAIDGKGVMEILGCGPGRHVGRALAYLSQLVANEPGANEPERLAEAVRAWHANEAHDPDGEGDAE